MAVALFSNAHPIYSEPQGTPATGTALDAEGAGLAGRAIRVKRINVRLLVVLVAGKLAASTYPDHLAARPEAFAPR
jgi:hypothetical protein